MIPSRQTFIINNKHVWQKLNNTKTIIFSLRSGVAALQVIYFRFVTI